MSEESQDLKSAVDAALAESGAFTSYSAQPTIDPARQTTPEELAAMKAEMDAAIARIRLADAKEYFRTPPDTEKDPDSAPKTECNGCINKRDPNHPVTGDLCSNCRGERLAAEAARRAYAESRPGICQVCNEDSPHGSDLCERCYKDAGASYDPARDNKNGPTVALYPVAGPLPLADFRERLELCRAHGVLHYEDHGLNIRFSEEQRQTANADSTISEEDRW